jgi:hypothetical protein
LKKDIKDGNVQEVLAIFDWKTSKGFYQSHEIQLEACRRLVEENFPEFEGKIERMFNVAPKGEKNLTCDMKDQTFALKNVLLEDSSFNEFDVYLAQYKAKYPNFNKPKNVEYIRGNITLDGDDELEIISESPETIVIEKHREEY